jgi:hypothetical protein
MPISKRGDHYYGESQADIREEIWRYSEKNGYLADHFAEAVCACGGTLFGLMIDEGTGAAVRKCAYCASEHAIGDSGDYLSGAVLEEYSCLCGGEHFEITVGVSLYDESEDVRWLDLGCRCRGCGLTGVYGDWKSESLGYRELLAKV